MSTSISSIRGEPDVDDYVSPMLTGESLSVRVVAARTSALVPSVQILDPRGADRTPALLSEQGGKAVSFTSLAIDVTGNWVVRIAGAGTTEGAYTASFKIGAATRFGTKSGTLGGASPATATHAFEVTNGAELSLVLRPVGKGNVVVSGVTGPTGNAVPDILAALKSRGGVTSLRQKAFAGGSGRYLVTVATTSPSVRYTLDINARPLPRAKGRKRLRPLEPRLDAAASPTRIAASFAVTFQGVSLSRKPPVRVFFGATEASVDAVAPDGTSVTVIVPELPGPTLPDVLVMNADGQTSSRGGLVLAVPRPEAVDLRDTLGQSRRTGRMVGGDVLEIVGAGFDEFSSVRFGSDAPAATQIVGGGLIRVTSPAHAHGGVDVVVTDDFDRSATVPGQFLFAYPGWTEGDTLRLPAGTPADDFRAARVATGDIDRDGLQDLVLGSPLLTHEAGVAAHGTRGTFTRVLRRVAGGTYSDATAVSVPAALSLPFPYDTDDWNAYAVAVADLDRAKGPDVAIAGFAEVTTDGLGDAYLNGQNAFVSGVRAFRNGGTGVLSLGSADQATPQRRQPTLLGVDGNGQPRALLGRYGDDRGDPTQIAAGDIDGDGDDDLVVAHDEPSFRRALQDLTHADFTKDPPTIPTADADAFVLGPNLVLAYVSGTRILENRLRTGGPLADVTELRMPMSLGGDDLPDGPVAPGYHADDVALADIDGDADLDMVMTWHDPTTVSVAGLQSYLQSRFDASAAPVSIDVPRVATRVLLNDGTGRFTDATAAWMPVASAPEFWQGDRLALTDVDGDTFPDLVLISRRGVEAWTTTALAPVTAAAAGGTVAPGTLAAAETEAYTFTVPATGRYVVEVSLGTLSDSTVALYSPGNATTPFATDDNGGRDLGSRIVRDLTAGTWTVKIAGGAPTDVGTFTLTVGGRSATAPAVPRTRTAVRVLHNDRANGRFIDVTGTAIPPLPVGDDFRGAALCVGDADGDGRQDIVFATTDALTDAAGARIPSLRLLRGGAGGAFSLATSLVPPAGIDSGEAEDLLLLQGPTSAASRSVLLVSRVKPTFSIGGRYTRLLDWNP